MTKPPPNERSARRSVVEPKSRAASPTMARFGLRNTPPAMVKLPETVGAVKALSSSRSTMSLVTAAGSNINACGYTLDYSADEAAKWGAAFAG